MSVTFLTNTSLVGHNNPPEPTPYERAKDSIEALFAEAKNWCDGEVITSQEQADELQKLMRLIQDAEKEADAARKREAQPFDEGKAEVQARYNPLIQTGKGKTTLAIQACKTALAPWLKHVDDENRRKAEEARKVAEDAQRVALAAFRERDAANLEQTEAAEALLAEAKHAEAAATKAEKAKAQAKGIGRAASLRTYYTAEIIDARAFASFVWTEHRDEMRAFLDTLAKRLVDAGKHELPGVTVHEDRRVA